MYAHVCLPGYFLFSPEQAPSNRDEPQRCRRHDGSVDQARHGEVRALQNVERDRERKRKILNSDFERDRDDLRHQ